MTDLLSRKQALVAYARSCLEAGDWRGCRDACSDLDVIEARLEERAGRIESVFYYPAKGTQHPAEGLGQRIDGPHGLYYEHCGCQACMQARG